MCTGFFQSETVCIINGDYCIASILFGALGSAYAFKDIFFKLVKRKIEYEKSIVDENEVKDE